MVSVCLLLLLVGPTLVTCLGATNPDGSRRIFLIAVGHDYGAHEYIDPKGYITGFIHDLIDAVCSEARIDCRTVWDASSHCWNSEPGSHPSGGVGLHSRYYDACAGWNPTIERIHTFTFSQPYSRNLVSYFYYKKGPVFDETDLQGKTIGFVQGWASSEQCVARQDSIANRVLQPANIKYYVDPNDLLEAVKGGEVQAAFADELTFSTDDVNMFLSYEPRTYNCILGGNSMMMRKDNDMAEYWNLGFQKLTMTNKYAKLCLTGSDKHGHKGDLFCLNQ